MKPLNLEIHFNEYGVHFHKKTKQHKIQLHISKLRALRAEGQLFKVTCKDEIEG